MTQYQEENALDLSTLALKDVINIDLLQRFQDDFAKGVGLACVTVDPNGVPITKPSCFTRFCRDYSQSTNCGDKRCAETHRKSGEEAARTNKPVIYECHAGLIGFAAPIMLNERQIGTILGGQVLIDLPDEARYGKAANEIGVDEGGYIEALQEIQKLTREKIEAAANVLFFVAKNLSNTAYQGITLKSIGDSISDGLVQVAKTIDQLTQRQSELLVKVRKIKIVKIPRHLM